ncbi:MAG: carboxypeptidase regulatory-like domain-containing protein, partial [Acidobacteriota bacterium]
MSLKQAFAEVRSSSVCAAAGKLLFLALLTLAILLPVYGQKTSGQISGTITDPNGAALPNTTITVTEIGTGATRTMTTNADGYYSVPDLAIGAYRLVVTHDGFKGATVQNVTVNVSTTTRQDIALEIGSATEQVNITADSVQVETQTGAVGEVITGQQVRELPLNGRSFVQLTQLVPGVSAQNNFDSKNKGLFAGVDFSVNGNSAQSNLFLTDGANNNDTGSNRTILLYPSIEAIAEFKMLRNSYGPEFGQAAGAVISIVTRGGENQLHGSLFYFGRNDALNSAEFFSNARGLGKDKLRRNDYGGSLGGPIIKDKLFFFGSLEWNKEIRGKARSGSVPTVAERTGDFTNVRIIPHGNPDGSDKLCDGPAVGVIPAANQSAAGQTLVKIFPLPNLAWSPAGKTCDNWATSANSPINFREYNIRMDYNVTDKQKIFGRFTDDDWGNAFPIIAGGLWGDDAFPTIESSWKQPARQAAVKLTSTLSNTSINEVQFSYSANRINVDPGNGADLNKAINTAIPGFFPDSVKVNGVDRPHPVFWGGINPFNSSTGGDLWSEAPFRNALDIYSLRDDFSKVSGNHTLKAGFLWDKASKNEYSGTQNETPAFWGACCANNSGNALADVLTKGSHFGFGESDTMAIGHARWTNLEFYFGDTWKVRSNLTLELGARYSILYEPYDALNKITSFSPAAYNPSKPASDPCNGLVVAKGAGNVCAGLSSTVPPEFKNRSLRSNNFKNIAPRLGIAWDIFGNQKTALRGGLGQFFLRERTSPVFAAMTTNPPFVKSVGGQRTLDGTDGLGGAFGTGFFLDNPTASAGVPKFSFDPRAATPYSWQFNVLVDQQLWKDTVLEVGYIGNRARDQLTNYDVNAVLPQNRLAAAFAPNAGAVNALRPFTNLASVYEFARKGRANYDSLQVYFKTRLSRNTRIDAAYTFSQSKADFGLSDSSGTNSMWALQDVNNPGVDLGKSDINRPHIFVANAIFNLPNFKGKNAFVQNALGGWEFATILQISSGTSLT